MATVNLPSVLPGDPNFSQGVLSGTWFVTRTSLPMWRTWHGPSITYSPLPGGEILDAVQAVRGGKQRLILGLDTPQPQAGVYLWRGLSPLTRLVRSPWQVIAHDPAASLWAVTVFARTPFTPAGLDVYTRAPVLLPDTEKPLMHLLSTLPDAAPFRPHLFTPQRKP